MNYGVKKFDKIGPEGPVALSTRSLETEELPEMWPVDKSDKNVFSSPVFTGAERQLGSNPRSQDRQSSALPTMLSLLTSGAIFTTLHFLLTYKSAQ